MTSVVRLMVFAGVTCCACCPAAHPCKTCAPPAERAQVAAASSQPALPASAPPVDASSPPAPPMEGGGAVRLARRQTARAYATGVRARKPRPGANRTGRRRYPQRTDSVPRHDRPAFGMHDYHLQDCRRGGWRSSAATPRHLEQGGGAHRHVRRCESGGRRSRFRVHHVDDQ